jgi:hypothetical protein
VAAPVAPPTAPVDPALAAVVGVVAARPPAKLLLDGDLAEWGPLPTPAEPPASGADPDEDPDLPHDKPAPLVPNPPDAPSRLALALTGESVLLAGELSGPASEGLWVGIAAGAGQLPRLGQWFGRMGFVPLDCAQHPTVTEPDADGSQGYGFEPNPPETVAACKAQKAQDAAAKAAHEKRFARLFRLDAAGLSAVGEGGLLAPVPGARVAWKRGERSTVEVSFPIAALPRVAEAPLAHLRLFARAASSSTPPRHDAGVWLDLPEPVHFEPQAALRAHAFARANPESPNFFWQPRGLSYQPGDDGRRIEVMDSPGCDARATREIPLYERRHAFGDVEIGDVVAPHGEPCDTLLDPRTAILHKGQLVTVLEPHGQLRGAVERGGALHLVRVEVADWGALPAVFQVLAVAPDGAHREVTVERFPAVERTGDEPRWEQIAEHASPDLATFGFRAVRVHAPVKGRPPAREGVELGWRWDEKRGLYAGALRTFAAPPPPKAKAKKRGK